MADNEIIQKVLADINLLFSKVFPYNMKLLKLCNDENYEPTSDDIFDFYITFWFYFKFWFYLLTLYAFDFNNFLIIVFDFAVYNFAF